MAICHVVGWLAHSDCSPRELVRNTFLYTRERGSRKIDRIGRTSSRGQDDQRETKNTCTTTSYRDTQGNDTIGLNNEDHLHIILHSVLLF
jgi:hypothetical protein